MPQAYRFGEFELDLDAQQLRLRGKPLRLERRPFDLLVLLVTRHGQLVPREEIIASLWPSRVIIDFESGLNTLVRKVRNALGDSSSNPKFIETVPGKGYRFVARVTEPATRPPATGATFGARALRLPVAAAALAFLLVAGLSYLQYSGTAETGPVRIAILPFENLTGNEELGYLASGIAEETNISLAQVDSPDLTVIGVVSSRALTRSDLSLQEIGRQLGADLVVASSLRQDQSRIRVTSRLLRVDDGEQIWSASFDRALTNVLGLQRELSVAIAEQIRQRLSPSIAEQIDRRQTRNPEAYELYLKGRHEWDRFQPDSVARALQYYRQAVATDPRYALAWAGIARALVTSIVTAEASRDSVRLEAQDALQQALEFGPELAETQLALGSFEFFLERDFAAAEAAARRAVAQDPNSAMARMFLGIVLSTLDKHVEARATLRRARELDPLFPLMFANSAVVALMANEPQEAVEFATQAIAIDPEFWVGYLHLGTARYRLGDYEGAIRAFGEAEKLSGHNSARAAAGRAYTLTRIGRHEEARDVLADLKTRSSTRFVSPHYIAVVHAGLGEVDAALEALEQGVTAGRVSWCRDLEKDSRLDILRQEPRFVSLLERCRPGRDRGAVE